VLAGDQEALNQAHYLSHQLFAANFRLYAGSYALGPQAEINATDGALNVIVCPSRKTGVIALLLEAASLRSGTLSGHAAAHLKVEAVSIVCDPPMPIQLDGDAAGWTPAILSIKQGAVRVACSRSHLEP
jgi:diacylglycerol kinase family enzyme